MERIKLILHRRNLQVLGLFTIVGAFIMTFCSYTSPAYYFDTSPDNNAFFTVGKAMMHGIVPYKDIFEQKGPFVYFLHGLAYLVSPRSFTLIFLYEIATLVAAMFLVYQIAKVFNTRELPALLTGLLSPALFLYHPYYDYGDTVEFFTLPFLLSLIYLIVLLDRRHLTVSHWWYVAQGALVGVVFLSKYTLLGAWIVFYLVLMGYRLVKRQWRALGQLVGWSALGFAVTTVPWLIYFLATKSLGAFVNVYILFNTKVYLTSSVAFFANLIQSMALVSQFYLSNVLFFVLGVVGTLVVTFWPGVFQHNFTRGLYLLATLGSDMLALYGYQAGAVYQYYELIYFAGFVLPFILGCRLLFRRLSVPAGDDSFVVLAALVISWFLVLGVNNNVTNSKVFPNNEAITEENTSRPQQPAQVDFGNYMRASGLPLTLLNYGSIDMGFYTASGAVPTSYYFQNYNIAQSADPQILRSQVDQIRQHKVEWVVLNTPAGKTVRQWQGGSGRITSGNLNPGTSKLAHVLYRNYVPVGRHTQVFEGVSVTYWLFERK
ncbi:MAG: glycosyltransferase family 39 protein [Levilactobacillus sp.]|uniref:ArnT family glycosyltransferase n=1 Tax=Levilactobacillus sp. TaxID=2767919 RepID=UPI00258CB1DA|nr:teichoic acid glycosyl transferase [Levilactobacillus sp.]MCI1553034.1 glycosyltransferase family 39 protein [Levilactobacillus sp.]MCI1598175.1 glycosyltransferase family 39 protein [Levilactobacillus sp.]MCI1605038.1 glycosyltransferase family 39 protein [Levilactobacillus sp.]